MLIELIFYSLLLNYISNEFISSIVGVLIGIAISFVLNIKYNFKISVAKRDRALYYFVFISILSYLIQAIAREKFMIFSTYEWNRIFYAGCFFWIGYAFHLKISFRDYKKVGVAIYANGVEKIDEIFNKVDKYADFIHIDILDQTFNSKAEEVLSYKAEVVKAYWKNKFIEAHIMSRKPTKWVKEIAPYVDRIYVHVEIDEPLNQLLDLIKDFKCECGIVIQKQSHIKYWDKYHDKIDSILILAIENPGYSGQQFLIDSLKVIEKVNNHCNRNKISLNVDGGISDRIIKFIKAEYVVSGSYILNAKDPVNNIMILQTSSQYE